MRRTRNILLTGLLIVVALSAAFLAGCDRRHRMGHGGHGYVAPSYHHGGGSWAGRGGHSGGRGGHSGGHGGHFGGRRHR